MSSGEHHQFRLISSRVPQDNRPPGRAQSRIGLAGLALSSQIWAQPIARDGSPTGPSIALTNDTSRRNSVPAISPDGSKVAYASTRRGQLGNVWIMDIDGRHGIQLTSDETADFHPSWFPDGRRVAYASTRGETDGIWSVDIATRRETLVVDVARARVRAKGEGLTGKLGELRMAPSMTRAAFSLLTPPAGRRVMYVGEIEPFTPRALTDGALSVGYPAWSPDERRIAVEIQDGSATHAGVIDVQTRALRQLTHDRGQTQLVA